MESNRSFTVVNFLAAIAIATLLGTTRSFDAYTIGLLLFELFYWLDDFTGNRDRLRSRLIVHYINHYLVAGVWVSFIFAGRYANLHARFVPCVFVGVIVASASVILKWVWLWFHRRRLIISCKHWIPDLIALTVNMFLLVALLVDDRWASILRLARLLSQQSGAMFLLIVVLGGVASFFVRICTIGKSKAL